MATIGLSRQNYRRTGFIVLLALFSLWITSQAVGQVRAASAYETSYSNGASEVTSAGREQASDTVATAPALPAAGETEEAQGWFVHDEESQWTAQEMSFVVQIMEHTWQALDGAGVDGRALLNGYRFRRAAAEFVPGRERYLAMVNHREMEITLANRAFERLHGFYIYHELGHAVDQQLGRLPSDVYHRIAGQAQEESATASDTWSTTTGFWLRYNGRDNREEATADAFAWWVMAQAEQPKPFFPGTPPSTDYNQIAGTIEEAVREAAAVGTQPA